MPSTLIRRGLKEKDLLMVLGLCVLRKKLPLCISQIFRLNMVEIKYKENSVMIVWSHSKLINLEETISDINNDNTPCEMQLFKGPEALPIKCSIHVGDDTLTISCRDLTAPFLKEVKVSGTITIVDTN
ncbi:Envelope fusion protein [Aphis craccivora]|uniref:Envelope fusion protein n=1 Tax=Aphis craccivora TaxID=307492 RepID=A0A6G0W6S7_APHCR|nr:Envelope fusion protein [Aphis craccivora]